MYCEKCGQPLPDDANFCLNCGTPRPQQQQYQQQEYQQPYQQPQPAAPSYSEPLSTGEYIAMFLLMLVPIVNIVMLFVWAFGANENQNRRNFARAQLIIWLISVALSIFFGIAFISLFAGLFARLGF